MADRLVLVNGLPGSGKSTLAAPLARSLDALLLSKDTVKEALADVVDPGAGALFGPAVEVWCDVARGRFEGRTARHAVHADGRDMSAEWARWSRGGPLGLGPVVLQDTSVPVGVAELAERVRATLAAAEHS